MALTYRDTKGQALTAIEHDANTRDLDQRPLGQVYPKTQGIGVKVDTDAPDWGWHDLKSDIILIGAVTDPSFATYIGNIEALQMSVGNAINLAFHMPHDYAMGTDVFIHFHWSHNSATMTTGNVSGIVEASYAKGHNQGAFGNSITLNLSNIPASPIRYQHLITEGQLSASLGAGGLLVTEDLEPDGMALCRMEITGNTMDGGAEVFLHQVDLHYQSTGMATKNKEPDFWGAP